MTTNTQLMVNINTQVKTIQVLTLVLASLNINILFSQTLDMPGDGSICVPVEPTFLFSSTDNSTLEIMDCNASDINLSAYSLEDSFWLEVNPAGDEDDLSGITYNSTTNTLFAITNGGKPGSHFEAIYEVDLNGNILQTYNLVDGNDSNNPQHFYDTEGIVHMYDRTFAVVEERRGKIAIIDLPITNAAVHQINYSDANIIQIPETWGANNGLEGISYDPIANQFHVCKETATREYYVVDVPTVFPANTINYTKHSMQTMNMTDAAGTHYLGLTDRFANSSIANHRLIVDEAGQKVVEIDANYQIIGELPLPATGYEGITMDNEGNIYIVQEPSTIHVYTNPNPSGVIYSAEVSQQGYFMPPDILEEATQYCWRVIGDDGGISETYSFTTLGTTTICTGISSGSNDIEELQNGNIYVNSSDLELIYDSNTARLRQKIGLRYEDLGIPRGSVILNAYIQFTTDEISSGTVNLTIKGEDADDASAFSLTNGSLSARPSTAAAVTWSPPAWNTVNEQGLKQQTPDLKNIVQEIVNRNGFDQSSALVFIISSTDTNKRIAESFEGDADLAPQLCITFTQSCEGNRCVDASLKLTLEGAYNMENDIMRTGLKELTILPLENIGSSPTPAQPYFQPPWNYPGTEGAGWQAEDYDADVVDWVLVSFRKTPEANSEVFKTAALLHKDGNVHFLEQCPLPDALLSDSLYIAIDHRNHLAAMSHIAIPSAVTLTANGDEYGTFIYDFRQQNSYHTESTFGQKLLPNGEWALFAGDVSHDNDINGADKGIWNQENGRSGEYLDGDTDLNGDVNGSDKGVWSENSGYSSGVPR